MNDTEQLAVAAALFIGGLGVYWALDRTIRALWFFWMVRHRQRALDEDLDDWKRAPVTLPDKPGVIDKATLDRASDSFEWAERERSLRKDAQDEVKW